MQSSTADSFRLRVGSHQVEAQLAQLAWETLPLLMMRYHHLEGLVCCELAMVLILHNMLTPHIL